MSKSDDNKKPSLNSLSSFDLFNEQEQETPVGPGCTPLSEAEGKTKAFRSGATNIFRKILEIKRSSRGRYLRRRASASMLVLYQIRAEMSMIRPCFVIIISFLICFLDLA